jgi:hypothetical protein
MPARQVLQPAADQEAAALLRFVGIGEMLGVDLLRSQRLWLSYGSQQIFLSHRA